MVLTTNTTINNKLFIMHPLAQKNKIIIAAHCVQYATHCSILSILLVLFLLYEMDIESSQT